MKAKKLNKGRYEYYNYLLINCRYHAPDQSILWEAVNKETGWADYHAESKKKLIIMIDSDMNK